LPSGEVHYQAYLKGFYVTIPSSVLVSFVDWKVGAGTLVGYWFHRYCDNDLDQMGVNSAEGRQVNELPIIGILFFGFSSMYGAVFRRYHRHWITHFPIISTLIRIIFLFWCPFLILDGYGVNFIGNGWWKFWLGFWSGLSIADGIHWKLDKADARKGKSV